jgi:hypothetical protein
VKGVIFRNTAKAVTAEAIAGVDQEITLVQVLHQEEEDIILTRRDILEREDPVRVHQGEEEIPVAGAEVPERVRIEEVPVQVEAEAEVKKEKQMEIIYNS